MYCYISGQHGEIASRRIVLLILALNFCLISSTVAPNSFVETNDLKFVGIVSKIKAYFRPHNWMVDFGSRFTDMAIVLLKGHISRILTKTTLGLVGLEHYRRKVHCKCTIWENTYVWDTNHCCRQTASTRKITCEFWAVNLNAPWWVPKVCWPDFCHLMTGWTHFPCPGNQFPCTWYQSRKIM